MHLKKSTPITISTLSPDGEDALDFLFRRGAHINATGVDLVLLDLNLPVMNGHAVLREIRANSNTKLLPVVNPQFLECAQRCAAGIWTTRQRLRQEAARSGRNLSGK